MSNLQLNVPITFDASAALDINGELNSIKSTVQGYSGDMTTIEQNAGQISLKAQSIANGLQQSGIDINSNQITLKSNSTFIEESNGNKIAAFENGKLNASLIDAQTIFANNVTTSRLETTGNGNYSQSLQKAHIVIQDGLFKVFGDGVNPNIVIGYDETNGYAVLQYYDNNGTLLYDLGPNGIHEIEVVEENVFEEKVYYMYTSTTSNSPVNLTAVPNNTDTFQDNMIYSNNYYKYLTSGTNRANYFKTILDDALSYQHLYIYNNINPQSIYRYVPKEVGGSIDKGVWATSQLATNAKNVYFDENPLNGSNLSQSWFNQHALTGMFINTVSEIDDLPNVSKMTNANAILSLEENFHYEEFNNPVYKFIYALSSNNTPFNDTYLLNLVSEDVTDLQNMIMYGLSAPHNFNTGNLLNFICRFNLSFFINGIKQEIDLGNGVTSTKPDMFISYNFLQ